MSKKEAELMTEPAEYGGAVLMEADDNEFLESSSKSCCGKCCNFDGVITAKGYCILGVARGALVMSNIFLATAFIFYANEFAGCLDEEGETIEDCEGSAYGFKPASLISNIAVISGLMSAFLMPITGAIVDYSPYRRFTGIAAAVLMTIIQAVQIGTVRRTWFPMLILQAISGFLYQVEVLATYAYLPEIAREAGEQKMRGYSSIFTSSQFGAQAIFLIVVVGLSLAIGFGSDDALVAKVSQGINTVWIGIFFSWGWAILPSRPSSHELPEGRSLVTQGFVQIWQTTKRIFTRYTVGLRWYLLSIVFAEASVNAFTTVSVVFLDEQIGLTGTEIGIFFFITLAAAAILGTPLASFVTARTNPNTSFKLSMIAIIILAVVGALVLNQGSKIPAFIWGVGIGTMLGWFYPTENLFFSMTLPKGQEAELSGFFVYCTQVIGWLPPLVFTILIENGVNQRYGLLAVSSFLFVAIGLLCMTGTWDEIVADVQEPTADHSEGTVDGELNDKLEEDEEASIS